MCAGVPIVPALPAHTSQTIVMKLPQTTSALLGTCLLTAGLSTQAQVLLNDTWADGSRTEQNLPTESQWFNGGTGATLTPSVGHLVMGVPATSSASWTTYFAAEGSEATLANTGDTIKLTWTFTPANVNLNNTSQNFRLALVNTPGADRLAADGAPGTAAYTGYGMFMNLGQTLGNSNPFRLMERNVASGAMLGTSGDWAGLANGATSGNHGYDSGTAYTLEMTLTRNALSGLDFLVTMTGGTLNNSGSASLTFTDATPNSFSFDTFSLRPSGASTTADSFDTTLVKVELSQVPEPTAATLLGMGLLGIYSAYRRSRQ